MLFLVAGKVLLLPFAALQCLLLGLTVFLQGCILNVYLGLRALNAFHLFLPVFGKLLHIAHTAYHLLETVG